MPERQAAQGFAADTERQGSGSTETPSMKCSKGCQNDYAAPMGSDETTWLSTKEAARRLGITPRTLYRFVDMGELTAYRLGRVIRLQQTDVDAYIETCKVEPGTLEHLYPDAKVD